MNAIETIERPILFSGPMVRAILADEKMQTRRQWKLPAGAQWYQPAGWELDHYTYPNNPGWWHVEESPCPYGKPGDRLWVRETWGHSDDMYGSPIIVYRSDMTAQYNGLVNGREELCGGVPGDFEAPEAWKPSIFMPRWACRLLLEITEIRVERVQEITEADAITEGVRHAWDGFPKLHTAGVDVSPVSKFGAIWRQINGVESWESNPWVWVVSFKRIKE